MSDLEAAARLHREGRLEEALARYRELRTRDPASAELAFRVALVHAERGDAAAAGEALASALATRDDPRFHLLEADLRAGRGDAPGAIAALRAALALNASFAPAHARLALLLHDRGEADAALEHFAAVADLEPNNARALGNLAAACDELGSAALAEGRVSRAHALLARTTRADPRRPGGWLRLAAASLHLGRTAEAIAAYERAEALDPPDAREIASARLVALHYDERRTPREVFEAHRAWAARHAPAVPAPAFANDRDRDRRLRVGYVSPRFHEASLASLLVPALRAHDPKAVEIFCYAHQDLEDDVTRAIRGLAAGWVDARPLDDAALARRMRDDRIDVAVDLAGHTPGSRVAAFAHWPAPATATWLDYFDTTGLDAIDALITDALHSPADGTQPFAESPVRLPRLRYCFAPPAFAPAVRVRPGDAPLVLGSFNRMAKLSGATLATWAALLLRLPQARVVIKNSALGHAEDRAAFAVRLREHGLDPARFECRGYSPHAAMLDEYNDLDIVLDTFPYTGGITTLEALWMGRPVVSLRGETLLSRQGAALLQAAGLDELVARDREGYVDAVVALASDPARRARLSEGMRERLQGSAITDATGLARALEACYRQLWTRWLDRSACAA